MIYESPQFRFEDHFGRVFVDGQRIPFEDWSVSLPCYDEAENCTIRACWNIGGDGLLASNGRAETALISGKDVPLRIEIAERTLLAALLDEVQFSADMSGEAVTITGRGKVGRMTERKEIRNVKNRTASSLATEVFKYHGLTPIVTDTTALVGSYSEGGTGTNSATSNNMDDWELLNWLAEQEGYTVRVHGTTGYFGPHDGIPETKLPPLTFTYGKDCTISSWSRKPSSTRDIIIEGRSYYKKTSHVEHYPRPPKEEDDEVGETAVVIKRTLPGCTPEQLRRRVRAIYEEMTKKDIDVTISVPFYTELNPDRRIELLGVGNGFSAVYYATRVTYSESMDGVTTEIELSNKVK